MPFNSKRKGRRHERTPSPPRGLDQILKRLQDLEERTRGNELQPALVESPGSRHALAMPSTPPLDVEPATTPACAAPASTAPTQEFAATPLPTESDAKSVAERFLDAMMSFPVRSNQYFVSDFDPSVHDVDTWCDEVDKARSLNRWEDGECLARVGRCLKGEARTWLSEWTSTTRTWSNFKLELKSLCPRSVDIANILYNVMCTESDKYSTYAEYARKSLLKLRIVKGLSSELLTAIIIRGITDPQVRASARNAKLTPESIVDYLSSFVKCSASNPNRKPNAHSASNSNRNGNSQFKRKSYDISKVRCYQCSEVGHKRETCPKRPKSDSPINNSENNTNSSSTKTRPDKCGFCKKVGHTESHCFAKERVRNNSSVNFCRENEGDRKNSDVTTAVISNIPVDVLIDSGSAVSLITSDLIKYFSCRVKPAFQLLRGLGGMEVVAKSMITLPMQLNNMTLEVDFYVVDKSHLNVPVIIGTDVLNRKGVAYIRTGDSQYIVHSDFVNNITQVDPSLVFENISTHVTGQDREQLLKVLYKYSNYFLSGTATTTVKDSEMQIKLTSDTPIYYRPYKLSYDEKIRVRAIVKDLLEKGIIRESESEYASPILLVKKKDGSDRMVVDYRALNQITVKVRHPLPLINDHVDMLGKAKWFSALDMVSGFHQLRVSEDSIHKTAFITPEGHYEYCKMPYGLANAPVIYQKTISKTLKSFIESGKVLVYVDDVLLLSDSIGENLMLLDAVLETLTQAGFSINLKKCSFLTNEIEYLGRIISQGQVRPSKHKVEALIRSPRPNNVKQVRQFLGLAGYFRRYVPSYAIKTACMAALTRKGVVFNWSDEHEKARQEIISYLTSEPLLTIFDPDLPTQLHTDASAIGYGGILMQIHKDGRKRVVAYFSKLTVGAESRYHSYELETLAVVKSLQHFRQYLVGIPFKIITDCNALKMTQRKKDLQPRVARWWIYMQDFNFTLEYRKGCLMSHVDYLSRNPVNVINAVQKPLNWAQIAQAGDEETMSLIEKLNNGELDSSRYVKRNDLLYYKYCVEGELERYLCYVPKAFRLSLLRVFHDEHEHLGMDKTIDLILKHFWFPGLRRFVTKYITHCVVCISHKQVPRAPLQPISSWQKNPIPFDTVHADVLGPLRECNGFKYVLIIVDAYTKYCLLYSLYRQDCDELKRVVTQTISLFGTFKRLVCDRSRMFDNHNILHWLTEFGIEVHFITPEMHQENGQVERYCRTVLNMVRIEVNNNENEWPNVLWKLQLILNITKHKTTQYSALNLLIGTESTTPVINSLIRDVTLEGSNPNRESIRELRRQRADELINKNKSKQDAYVNKNRNPPKKFNVNDRVFVIKRSQSTGKLDCGMRGPYRVVSVLPNDRYELKLLAGSYGKTSQAAAGFMVLWRGEWTPDTCAGFFES